MNSDFKDLLAAFNASGVDYLVVGAHALAAHGHVRATKDLDVWVRPSFDNARLIWSALVSFGAPLDGLSVEDFGGPGIVFQIGVAPVRIDIITSIDGVEFDEAWLERVSVALGDLTVGVLSRRHLIVNKRTAGRLQDLADVERLEAQAEPE